MDDHTNIGSGNPYASIDCSDDEPQPYCLQGDVLPWEEPSGTEKRRPLMIIGDDTGRVLQDDEDRLRLPVSGFDNASLRADSVSPQNPYARIDEMEESVQQHGARHSDAADACGRFASSSESRQSRPGYKHYTDEQIEEIARRVQTELWQRQRELRGNSVPGDPIQLLDAAKALGLHGYRVRYGHSGLGQFRIGRTLIDVAGLVDPASRSVEISTLASPTEQSFTLAHELGHIMLGSVGAGVHRDRALNGTVLERDPIERAANKFAAYFLMPTKLVRQIFIEYFLTGCFELTEETAFALAAASLDVAQRKFPTCRDLSRELASTEHYNGRVFRSIAARFNVSVGAMAIRLEELGLIRK